MRVPLALTLRMIKPIDSVLARQISADRLAAEHSWGPRPPTHVFQSGRRLTGTAALIARSIDLDKWEAQAR